MRWAVMSHYKMKIFAIISTLIAIISLAGVVYLFQQSYDRVHFFEPIDLVREAHSVSPIGGLWTGTFYYPQDCGPRGCETRERVELTIRNDSTARLVIAIDTLSIVYIPMTNLIYARSHPYRVSVDHAILEPDSLRMLWDSSYAVSYKKRGDTLMFEYLDSSIMSY